ncbi:MAG: clcA 1, partial [Mucilaginibacter sp.]|nr:clcA 1 [Mucilaginibacter sp.]
GSIKLSAIYNTATDGNKPLKELVSAHAIIAVKSTDTLRQAIEKMANAGAEILPVLSNDNKVIGVLSYKDIINAYTQNIQRNESAHIKISLKRRGIKMLIKGKRIN